MGLGFQRTARAFPRFISGCPCSHCQDDSATRRCIRPTLRLGVQHPSQAAQRNGLAPIAPSAAPTANVSVGSPRDRHGHRLLRVPLLRSLLYPGSLFLGSARLTCVHNSALFTRTESSSRCARSGAWGRFFLLDPFLYSAHGGVAPVTKPVFEEVGNYIAESPCKGPIFVWGYAPQVYYFAHRAPATRYVVPIEPITEYISGNEEFERGPLPAGLHVSEPRRQELLADLERNRPSHIVDFSSTKLDHWDRFPLTTFEGLHRFVADNYVNLDRPQGSVTIFERRSCSTPHASPHSP